LTAPRERDALAPGQPARMVNEHRWNVQRVLPDSHKGCGWSIHFRRTEHDRLCCPAGAEKRVPPPAIHAAHRCWWPWVQDVW